MKGGRAMRPCPGEAHENANIDGCQICAPGWGQIPASKAYLAGLRDGAERVQDEVASMAIDAPTEESESLSERVASWFEAGQEPASCGLVNALRASDVARTLGVRRLEGEQYERALEDYDAGFRDGALKQQQA